MTEIKPRHVHFVGSIALESVDEVFETCGRLLGSRLKRLPDGEPGGRRLWVSWQLPLLRASAYLELEPSAPSSALKPLRLKAGVKSDDIRFGELGYCREARTSYQDFLAARDQGIISKDTRFQVSLPTPFAVISPVVVGDGKKDVLLAYERAMLSELSQLCAAIPHHDLAIQWDVCLEMVAWDGQPSIIPPLPDKERVVPPPIARLVDAVPAAVEVGVHLCYGDFDAKHFIEPRDMERMVSLSNAIAAASARSIDWFHMPVPKERNDDAFFAPLRGLKVSATTEIYLGVVHEDGPDATAARIRAAEAHRSDFGIATECGIARQRTPAQVQHLIQLHRECAAEPA